MPYVFGSMDNIEIFFASRSGVYNEPNCDKNILGYLTATVVGYGSLNNSNYWVIFKFVFLVSEKISFLIIFLSDCSWFVG